MRDRLYKDNGEEIKDFEWERAIAVVLKNVPPDIIQDLAKAKEMDGNCLIKVHHTFGKEVRNLLRKDGFNWGAIALDQNWTGVVEDAIDAWIRQRDRSG